MIEQRLGRGAGRQSKETKEDPATELRRRLRSAIRRYARARGKHHADWFKKHLPDLVELSADLLLRVIIERKDLAATEKLASVPSYLMPAAADLATTCAIVRYFEEAPVRFVEIVGRLAEVHCRRTPRVPAWQVVLTDLFRTASGLRPPEATRAAAIDIVRALRFRVPDLPPGFVHADQVAVDRAVGVLRELQGRPGSGGLRVTSKPGGGFVSPWAAAARFARAFGVPMKARRSDAERDWSKYVRPDRSAKHYVTPSPAKRTVPRRPRSGNRA
jgi:hypothetical protein